jgi:Holliday junction DNA helicase RuvA
MVGFITGSVLFSDGKEAIIQSRSGVGYQLYCYSILPEGGRSSVFVSHIVRENSEELYSFKSLREKKLFELLITVKGVGPRSAYSVLAQLGSHLLVSAVKNEDKTTLKSVSGVGDKAASQMILDLKKKIQNVMMYSDKNIKATELSTSEEQAMDDSLLETIDLNSNQTGDTLGADKEEILNETLLACQNLGFNNDKVVPLAQRILQEHDIQKTEQLVHLVLKEI